MIKKLTTSGSVKVASLLVHADELASQVIPLPEDDKWAAVARFDAAAILSQLQDPEVKDWLASFPSALLPVKR